jgi:DNA excision repair protein ERCC-2
MPSSLRWQDFWPDGRSTRSAARPGLPSQHALLDDWTTALSGQEPARFLISHAPTGLGKTAAALAPALAWLASAPGRRRVFYLVNRIAQHDNPLRELRAGLADRFRAAVGRELRLVDLVGREQLCLHPNERPLADLCRDSRERATFEQLPSPVASWAEVRDHLADACPYHALQGLLREADLVIADYWWLFSRLAVGGKLDRLLDLPAETAVIVDEAHNLSARTRAELDFDEPLAAFRDRPQSEHESVARCLAPVLNAVAESDPEEGVAPSVLLHAAGGEAAVRAALDAFNDPETVELVPSAARRLLTLLELPDPEAVIYLVPEAEGAPARVVGRVVDPTPLLVAAWGRVTAGLCMSGTLAAPADDPDELRYLVPLFGLPPGRTAARKYASPFPPDNRRWVFCPDTLGIVRRRESFYPRYAAHLEAIGRQTPGITAVFFSSYAFLEAVRDQLSVSERGLVVSEGRADAAGDSPESLDGYRARLAALRTQRGRAYLFAVYAGKIAEGADFAGNLIRTVVCVSLPLEWPQLFHRRLRERFAVQFAPVAQELGDRATEKAEEYAAARAPLALVLQACGRGLRSPSDRCAFVLLDARYGGDGRGPDWRAFLEPPPYNAARPELAVQTFHAAEQSVAAGDWDPVVLAACGRGS